MNNISFRHTRIKSAWENKDRWIVLSHVQMNENLMHLLLMPAPLQVYCLSPAGTRGETVHELDAIVHQQTQPVPHGFLAKSVRVYGPFEMESCVPDITHAKFTVG